MTINCSDFFSEEFNNIAGGSSTTWQPGFVTATVVFLVMLPVILCSNVVVIVCVVKFKRLQIPANYFLSNLAVSDILVGVSMPLVYLTESQQIRIKDGVACLLVYCVCIVACSTSLLNLTITAYDRYSALVTPLKYAASITVKSTTIVIILTWIAITAIGFAPLMGWYHDGGFKTCSVCSFRLINQYCVLFLICAVFLPNFICICCFYYRIMSIARKQSRAISAIHLAVYPVLINKNLSMQFKGSKYAKTLAIIMGIFMLSWLPLVVTLVVEILCRDHFRYHYLYSYFTLLIYCNSALNPWIYSFKNNDFKAALRRLRRKVCTCCNVETPSLNRSASRASIALSRTNSLIGTVNLQMLYETYKDEPIAEVPNESVSMRHRSSEGEKTVDTGQTQVQCVVEPHQQEGCANQEMGDNLGESDAFEDVSELECSDTVIYDAINYQEKKGLSGRCDDEATPVTPSNNISVVMETEV